MIALVKRDFAMYLLVVAIKSLAGQAEAGCCNRAEVLDDFVIHLWREVGDVAGWGLCD